MRRSPWLALLAVPLLLAFGAAGWWQYQRGVEKARWLESYTAAISAPTPTPLETVLDGLGGSAPDTPRRVTADVELSTAPLLLLDNQQHGGRVGIRVYAVGRVADRASGFLVELGWLLLPPTRELPELQPPPAMLNAVDGLLLAPPSAGLRLGQNDWSAAATGRVLLNYLDPAEIAAALDHPILPVVLRPDPANPVGYLRTADALPNTLPPSRHYGYAVQWFALAAATVVVTLILLFRLRRK